MSALREFNISMLEEYNSIANNRELSSPLLISSEQSYIDGLERKIMYVGQETNCWFNYGISNSVVTAEDLEAAYFSFLKEGARNREFWKFYKQILSINDEQLIKNVIWTNTFIAGKRREMGAPCISDSLLNISLEYLLFVKDYFQPEHIILVNGPTNPYYELTIQFLKEIKSSLVTTYPTKSNPLVVDNQHNILWTYHPAFQNRIGIKEEVMSKIKSKLL
ncbi:MAG: hypothetical protein E7173_03265 [Firmicutes bacterium]|nr:hypothetical protein [Bacillota bacterium]